MQVSRREPRIQENPDKRAESRLVRRINAGDPAAFRQMMEYHNQDLYRVARAIVADDAEAEDVLQESYVRAFAAMDRFRGDARLGTWLTRIVINESRGRLRRRRRHVNSDQVEATEVERARILGFPGGQPVESPDVHAARAEARILIERAVDALPETFRPVFILRDIQGLSVEQAAEVLGIRPETVKTRLFRARRLMRQSLDATLADVLRDSFPFLGKRCEGLTNAVLKRLARSLA